MGDLNNLYICDLNTLMLTLLYEKISKFSNFSKHIHYGFLFKIRCVSYQ